MGITSCSVNNHVERLVGWLQRQVISLLRRPGKPDGQRRAPGAQRLQRAVIKPAAIAQPPAGAVKRHQRTITISGSKKSSRSGTVAPNGPAIMAQPGSHLANFSAMPAPWITGTPTWPCAAASAMAGSGSISVRIGMYPDSGTPR